MLKGLRARYSFYATQGKWRFSGKVSFFGSNRSGLTKVRFWDSLGDENGTPQAIDIFAYKWQDLENSRANITRYHWIDGLDQWVHLDTMGSGFFKDGKMSYGDYVITMKKL